jgi:hypothetical protein
MPHSDRAQPNSQRIFSTVPHQAPCHASRDSRGPVRGSDRCPWSWERTMERHLYWDAQSTVHQSEKPSGKRPSTSFTRSYTVVPSAGSAWSLRVVATVRYTTLLFTPMRGEETVERSHVEAIEQHVEYVTRFSSHRSDHGYGRIEPHGTRRAERSKSSIKLPISPV